MSVYVCILVMTVCDVSARHGLDRGAGEVVGAAGRQGGLLHLAAGAQQQVHGRAVRRRALHY